MPKFMKKKKEKKMKKRERERLGFHFINITNVIIIVKFNTMKKRQTVT